VAKSAQLLRFERRMEGVIQAAKSAVRPSMEKSANEIVALAKSLVPEDTGTLRDSIGWTWGDAPAGSITLANAQSGNMTITIYAGNSDAFYARWVEFGTSAVEAHPYFYVAYRLNREKSKRRIKRAIGKAVRTEWDKP
jgi:HK97 gp10 family phage protein